MLDLNYAAITAYFIFFFSLLIAFGPKTLVVAPRHSFTLVRFGRALLGRHIMDTLTRWVPNGPCKLLLEDCSPHVMNEPEQLPIMDDWYFAHRTWTSTLRGQIGGKSTIVKVWRGAHMRTSSRKKFAQQLSRELDRWKCASTHPNVAPFLGVMSGFGHLPSLVQPFYAQGNINEYLLKHPGADSLYMLSCVADALNFMHNLTPPIVHGGVRGSNILISDDGVPLLSDTSVCRMPHPPDLTYIGGEFLGTRWMAPEVIDPPYEPELESSTSCIGEIGYETPQSDVYSFGMTILEILSGRHPFAHRRLHTGVIFDVVQGIRPPRPDCAKMTDPLWDLVQSCWKQDPQERLKIGVVRGWLQLITLISQDHTGTHTRSDNDNNA